VEDLTTLRRYMRRAARVSGPNPVLVDKFLDGAVEVDVDAIADGADVHIAGVMEQVEEAGVHSGDSACSLPPHSLSDEVVRSLEDQTRRLARRLGVVGLMNVQFAVRDGDVYVLEVNPRASRTVPFVAKATGVPVAKIAAQVMAGEPLASFGLVERRPDHVSVKEAVLPFARFPGADVVLSPEMRSTGESMGIDADFDTAYLKAQLGARNAVPDGGNVLLCVRDADKPRLVPLARDLRRLGFELLATRGTAALLSRQGVPVRPVRKVEEGSPTVLDLIDRGEVQLLVDTALGSDELSPGRALRRRALDRGVPYCSRLSIASAMVRAIERARDGDLGVRPLQAYGTARALKLFVRQPLTQSGDESKAVVDRVLTIVEDIARSRVPVHYLTGKESQSNATFRDAFERRQGVPFTPVNFRNFRLGQLDKADGFLYIRTAMSESGAFEVSYNVFAGRRAPMFFAVWKNAPIRTTLLRELQEVCEVVYCEFDDPEELRPRLEQFLERLNERRRGEAAPTLRMQPLDRAA